MYYYAIFNYVDSLNDSTTNIPSSNDDRKELMSVEDADLIPEITFFETSEHSSAASYDVLSSPSPTLSPRTKRAVSPLIAAATAATTIELSPSAAHSNNRATCAICIVEYKAGDNLKILPNCHHVFHKDCIIPWLTERSGHCPLCRVMVRVGSKEVGKQRRWKGGGGSSCPGVACSIQ